MAYKLSYLVAGPRAGAFSRSVVHFGAFLRRFNSLEHMVKYLKAAQLLLMQSLGTAKLGVHSAKTRQLGVTVGV